MFSLNNKSAIITGGGSGIGKAIAVLFAQQGATVHIIEMDTVAASATVSEIQQSGGKAAYHQCDVSKQAQVVGIFNSIGQVDILVNNAGIAHIGSADTTAEADFDRVMNVNVKGAYNCLFAAIPLMKAKGGGVISKHRIHCRERGFGRSIRLLYQQRCYFRDDALRGSRLSA